MQGNLSAHSEIEGKFEILILKWKPDVDVEKILQRSIHDERAGPYGLVETEVVRVQENKGVESMADWKPLWFLGESKMYKQVLDESKPGIHCRPYQNTGILQHNLDSPLSFETGTDVSRQWMINSLPSRLREDTALSHDDLSLAFAFDDGRDLTYIWSWNLPEGSGYWCPPPAWADREYHIVIRSGTERLGKWIAEGRNIYDDYVKYVEKGNSDQE